MRFKDYLQLLKKVPIYKWKDTFSNFYFPFESCMGVNDYWALLFICCFSLFLPKLLWAIPLYIALKTNKRMVLKKTKKPSPELAQIVSYIKMNHLQSLTEALESNPSLILCEYKNKSLHSWCEFYNNPKAGTVISQISNKNSAEKKPMAA
jgi:hypothetical protein